MDDPKAPARGWALRAGAAFLAAAGLLIAVHGGADGGLAGPVGASAMAPAGDATSPHDGGAERRRAGGTAGASAQAVETRRTVRLMGTLLEGTAWSSRRETGLVALEAAFEAVGREEDLLSTWREDTGLARLNAAAVGTSVRVPARLHALLEEARAISRATGGAFDPAVGALVDAWDLRGQGRRPSEAELASAQRASGLDCFEPGPGRRVTPRCPGAWIDAGAFGKGSGLRRARRALEAEGVDAALLDFGGQLLAVGAPPGRDAWPAAVAHPARRDSPLVGLRLRDRSAATTSASERFVTIDGEARGHVLDPRTGRPAPAWGSVTVVAEDPLRADALSTALFVMGPAEGWRWARGRDDVGVLLLELRDRGDEAGHPEATGASGHPEAGGASGGGEAATPEVTACWNAAMERWLTDVPEAGRCTEHASKSELGSTKGVER